MVPFYLLVEVALLRMASKPTKVASAKIRDAIGAMCQFLSLSGFSPISPETIRQAKFDKTEAIKQLLALLAELLEYSSSWKIKTLSELGREVLVYSVHSGMLVRHYERPQFYLSLDLCAAECHSSRELLIAIGWLLAEENLLRRLYLQENVGVRSFPDICQKVSVREQLSGSNQEMEWTQRLEEHLNRLLWNMGRCRMATKQLYWKQREIAKLTHKIHTSTQGKSLDKTGICLSPADVYILRYGDELRKHLEKLEKENKRLQIYFQWIEKEEIFWQWMETAVDIARPDQTQSENLFGPDRHSNNYWKMLEDCSSQLDESFRGVAERVQYFSDPFVAQHHLIKSRLIQCRGQDVSAASEALFNGTRECLPDLLDVRFEYVPKKSKELPSSSKTQVNSQTDLSLREEVSDIKEEILILSEAFKSLEASLSEQRESFSDSCSEMLSSLSGVVSIAPILTNQR